MDERNKKKMVLITSRGKDLEILGVVFKVFGDIDSRDIKKWETNKKTVQVEKSLKNVKCRCWSVIQGSL